MPSTQQASVLRQLQRTHGNGHVQELLGGAGPGYRVTTPGDARERQAGRWADAALGSRGSLAEAASDAGAPAPASRGSAVTPVVAAGIEALRGRGEPLSAASREFFEPRLGRDLEPIRVHTDDRASGLAEMLHADAFTVGTDLVFARGRYAPGTIAGQHRLAHELAHSQQAALGGASAQAIVARDKNGQPAPKTGLAGTAAAPTGDGMTVEVPITPDMATMDDDSVYQTLSRSAARLLLEGRSREPGEFELTLDRDNLRTIITRAGGWSTRWGAGNAASIVATAIAARQTTIPWYTTTDSFVTLVLAYREVARERKAEIERMLERIKNSTLPQDLALDFYRGQINGAIKFGVGLTDLPMAPVNLGAAVLGSQHRFHTLDLFLGTNVDAWQLDYASGYGKRYGGDSSTKKSHHITAKPPAVAAERLVEARAASEPPTRRVELGLELLLRRLCHAVNRDQPDESSARLDARDRLLAGRSHGGAARRERALRHRAPSVQRPRARLPATPAGPARARGPWASAAS